VRNPILTRFGASLFCLTLLLGISSDRSVANVSPAENELTVHEWGTFTSVTSKDGYSLTWRPLTVESDLPSFIYSIDDGKSFAGYRYPTKSSFAVHVRMETPVLYFYSSQEMNAKVQIDFPNGKITEWYPKPLNAGSGIDWGQIKIIPALRVELPHDAKQNHYYPARETDAAMLEVANSKEPEHERFLFYRGVGDFALPIWLRLQADKVVIKRLVPEGPGKAILFYNTAGQIGFSVLNLNSQETTVERPAVGKDLSSLRQELKSMMMSEGLYEKEADAMLNTWRDSWFEEGLRIFYVVPRSETDKILPLTIDPKPTSIVRVLIGRTELITPEMERNVTNQLRKLGDPSSVVRDSARKEISRYGRFVESIVSEIAKNAANPNDSAAANKFLLGKL
jgi:hypothetical protein